MPAGRPSSYTPELALTVCTYIAEGLSLRDIQAIDGMPTKTTIMRWLQAFPDFRDHYARACEMRTEAHADEILAIADDGSNDWMEKKFGDEVKWVENGEAIRRSQLRIDARKWLMSKLAPKKYGEKITQEITTVKYVAELPPVHGSTAEWLKAAPIKTKPVIQ